MDKWNERDSALVLETIKLFRQLQNNRTLFNQQWYEVACLILPDYKNFLFNNPYQMQGRKNTEQQIDSTGALALNKFGSICEDLLTPVNNQWHTLQTNNPSLNRSYRVRLWFEQATNVLFEQRYAPSAGFQGNQYANYLSLGAFGNQAMFVDAYDDPISLRKGLRYRSVPMGELYFYTNHQNVIIGFIRHFRMTARQCWMQFPDTFPDALSASLEQQSEVTFEFLHHVGLNDEYDPAKRAHKSKGKPWRSCYISLAGQKLLDESGYRSFPLAVGRYVQAPNEVYGRSPAMMVLPSLKTLNAEKAIFLRQGHRAAAPVLLINDDGLIDSLDLRPDAVNKGGVSADGRPLVHTLPAGDIAISEQMMQEERALIHDAFLINLFQILTETPQMTAAEVIERSAEKSLLLAPTIGRQAGEYLGTMIDRELSLLSELGLLPPMPPELIEARGEYVVTYTSPLAKAQRAREVAGALRTLESAQQMAQQTGDPSHLDTFNFDAIWPAIADIQSVPPSWMATPDQIAGKRQERADAMKRREQIEAMPAQAGMMGAQAKIAAAQAKAGPDGSPAIGAAPQGTPQFAGGQ